MEKLVTILSRAVFFGYPEVLVAAVEKLNGCYSIFKGKHSGSQLTGIQAVDKYSTQLPGVRICYPACLWFVLCFRAENKVFTVKFLLGHCKGNSKTTGLFTYLKLAMRMDIRAQYKVHFLSPFTKMSDQ